MRLIDADALIDNIYVYPDHEHSIMEDFAERVEMQDTVDAKPVKYGHWRRENSRPSSWVWLCSECGETAYFCNHKKSCSYRYCPNCGAKMDNTNETEVVNFSDGRKLVVPNGAFDSLYYSEDE